MTPDVMLLDVLSERDARAVARWRYPPPYDCYDAPPWSRMQREGWALCDGETRRAQFRALRPVTATASGTWCDPAGYVRFRPAEDRLVLHLGLRPDLCGQGVARAFLPLVVAEARSRARDGSVTLQVRAFNGRAITAYRRVGFRLVDTDGTPDDAPAAGDGKRLLTMVLGDDDLPAAQASDTRSR